MRFKGSPWWKQLTPLTVEEENAVRLPIMTALKRFEHGQADSQDMGVLSGSIRVCKYLTKYFENEKELTDILNDGYVALEMTRINGKIESDRIPAVRQAALLCDDLLMKCERFRVCEAIEKAQGVKK